ncbi:hypothetical protein [Nonomuraea ferruginea]|uniref:hypothetical protein n=1 Tax=Nonomuraea ferruginea TaxID=46174 RepID=UPI0031EF7AD5
MSASRRRRPAGTLPRPLAFLAAGVLAVATGAALSLLPARATLHQTTPRPSPPPARATPAPPPVPPGPSGFVTFVDTAADPGFDLPTDARRTGTRWYALGHLTAAPDGCAQRWAGRLAFGHDPVANRIAGLRALGGDAGLVFGGPAGEAAATCTRPGALAAAYRRAVGAFDARYVDFDLPRPGDQATVLRRARAIRAVQRERRLSVSFTLPLHPDGLSARDALMLRLTREAGARLATVNVLAEIAPQNAPEGRLLRLAKAVRAAQTQLTSPYGPTVANKTTTRQPSRPTGTAAAAIGERPRSAATAQAATGEPSRLTGTAAAATGEPSGLTGADRAAAGALARAAGSDGISGGPPRLALTCVLADPGDLSVTDARKLAAFAARHGLAWLSLRGAAPDPEVARALRS